MRVIVLIINHNKIRQFLDIFEQMCLNINKKEILELCSVRTKQQFDLMHFLENLYIASFPFYYSVYLSLKQKNQDENWNFLQKLSKDLTIMLYSLYNKSCPKHQYAHQRTQVIFYITFILILQNDYLLQINFMIMIFYMRVFIFTNY